MPQGVSKRKIKEEKKKLGRTNRVRGKKPEGKRIQVYLWIGHIQAQMSTLMGDDGGQGGGGGQGVMGGVEVGRRGYSE